MTDHVKYGPVRILRFSSNAEYRTDFMCENATVRVFNVSLQCRSYFSRSFQMLYMIQFQPEKHTLKYRLFCSLYCFMQSIIFTILLSRNQNKYTTIKQFLPEKKLVCFIIIILSQMNLTDHARRICHGC